MMTGIPTTVAGLAVSSMPYEKNFAIVESVEGDRVEFSFDLDRSRWPWLALPPQHPVLLEKYQYFTSITAGWATGLFEPATYSALTGFSWKCPELYAHCGYGSKAITLNREADKGITIDIDVYDDDEQLLVHMECIGAEFGDRDFKAWRAATRLKALEQSGQTSVVFAPPEKVGVGRDGISLISEIDHSDGMPYVTALVTSVNGFHPNHPYLTGSGDHVNVAHLFDCGMQTAQLIFGPKAALQFTGGDAAFMRFIELDVPFRISLAEKESGGGIHRLSFQLTQLDRVCTRIEFTLREDS